LEHGNERTQGKNLFRDHLFGHNSIGGTCLMEMKILLILIVSMVVIVATFVLAREYVTMQNKLKSLDERLLKLEEANKARVPYRVQDAVLDVVALVSDVIETNQDMNQLEKQQRERNERKLEDALNRLKNTLSLGTKRESK
jgi:hypothetical protein